MQPLEWIFFSCVALTGYVYLGYPLFIWAIGAVRPRSTDAADVTPNVSVLIAAHNEEEVIADKLRNTLHLDYPRERLEIIVVSDGSTDRTEEIVRAHADRNVRLLSLPRCGKAAALNGAAQQGNGEILLFTDANAFLAPDAAKQLVRHFHDESVGGVCGNLVYERTSDADTVNEGDNLYWNYDKWVKRLESDVASAVTAGGSLYAMRKSLFVPVGDTAQADDFAISAHVVVQGYRLIFEPRAVSRENVRLPSQLEVQRRIRVTNQTLRVLASLATELSLPRHAMYVFQLVSHKLARYLVPGFLLVAFLCNLPLAQESTFYRVLLVGQALAGACALVGFWLRHTAWGRLKLFYVPFYFCLANLAATAGIVSVIRGKRFDTWQPTRHQVERNV